jgi:hypothetical protein
MGSAAEETSVDQIHRLLVEVKDYLDAKDTKKSIRLAGKVEFVLENWNDDALFGSDEDEDGGGDGDVLDQELAEDPGYDEEDEEDEEGGVLDDPDDD